MIEKLNNEPVLISGLVQAALGLALAFGLDLSTEQVGGILACTAAVLAIVCRGRVSPVAKPARDEAGAVDVVGACIIAILVVLVLWWFGVRP